MEEQLTRRQRNYRIHAEQIRQEAKEYYQKNKDQILERRKKYREENKEYINEQITCNICGAHICRSGLKRHQKTKKCKAHPNDKYILVDGRTYLKGESPLEGVWHSDHTPFEVKKYVIFEKGVPRGISI
jgi:hypothetical protein